MVAGGDGGAAGKRAIGGIEGATGDGGGGDGGGRTGGLGGRLGGGMGGPTVTGALTKVRSAELTPRALASVVGSALCVARACAASAELADPALTTTIDASTS